MSARGAPPLLRAVVGLLAAAVSSTAAETSEEPPFAVDPRYPEALALVYDGSFHAAERQLADLARAHPEDPLVPYLQALALQWRLEQDPASRDLDGAVLAFADLALDRAAQRGGASGPDASALLARGAAHGVKSRLHLFRRRSGPARREAIRMRADLLAAGEAGVRLGDLDFGLGLYDYYADTLPRLFKLLRVLRRIPGGDRERGLDAIARVARGGSLHEDEACVQMYDILRYFEERPDAALTWIRRMWRRHPGWPRWGLQLADLLRDLGLFDECAEVARSIVVTAEERRHVNYQPVAGDMARVLLGEALLLDLRPGPARAAALPATRGVAEATWVAPRAALVVGRSLELEGDREAAVAYYRRAALGADPEAARQALAALAQPLDPRECRARRHLGRARRLFESGRPREAAEGCLDALRARPANAEARVCTAEHGLRAGDFAGARALVRGVVQNVETPMWLRPRARLVLAQALEHEGDTRAAVPLYKKVWEEPCGRPELRKTAAAAIARLDARMVLPTVPRWEQ